MPPVQAGRLGLNQKQIKMWHNMGALSPGGKTFPSSEVVGGSAYGAVGTKQSWLVIDVSPESGPRCPLLLGS